MGPTQKKPTNVWDQFSDPVDTSWDSISDPVDPNQTALDRAKLADPAQYDPNNAQYQATRGPTAGMSFGEKMLAGVGKAFVDVGRGAAQLGYGVADLVSPRKNDNLSSLIVKKKSRVQEGRDAVAEERRLSGPLMKTGAGRLGNFAGNVALAVPTVAIPGANTVVGAGAIGAGFGLLQPSTSTKETLLNTGIGGAVGAASQYAGNKIAGALADRAANKQAAAAAEQQLNASRDAVLKEAKDAGYVVPLTATKANAVNTALESVSGKAATRQAMSAKNARVTNKLVAQDLGLDAGKPITREALEGVRQEAGKAYQAVRSIGDVPIDGEYLSALDEIAQSGANLEREFPGIGAQANKQVKKLVSSLTPKSASYGSAGRSSGGTYSLDSMLNQESQAMGKEMNPLMITEDIRVPGTRKFFASNSSGSGYNSLLTESKDVFSANNLVSASRLLRNRASANFKAAFAQGGNPEKLELARAQSQAVNAIEDLIQRHLENNGQADLATAWDGARTLIAKSYQAESALKGGNVSAIKLAQQLQKGRPVSGGMGIAARFAEHFDEVAKLPKSGAGVSKLAAAIETTGVGGALAMGHPAAAATMAAAGAAPYATRNLLMSRVGQSLATPNYAPNLLLNNTGQALARYGRIPAAALAVQAGQ